jgi:hypothetical protein
MALHSYRAAPLFQLIEGLCTVSKPLTGDGSRVHDLFIAAFPPVLEALGMLPRHDAVKKGMVFFIHRMVDLCPAEAVLRTLPPALDTLLAGSDAVSANALCQLLNQLMTKYGEAVAPLIDAMFVPLITKLFELISTYAYVDDPKVPPSGYSAQKQERLEIQRVSGPRSPLLSLSLTSAVCSLHLSCVLRVCVQSYYSILLKIAAAGASGSKLTAVFSSARNSPHFKKVIETVVRGCMDPQDSAVRPLFSLPLTRGPLEARLMLSASSIAAGQQKLFRDFA